MAKHIREGVYIAELRCQLCGSVAELAVGIWPRITIDHDSKRIGVKVKATPVDHVCGRPVLYRPDGQIPGQTTIDDHLTDADRELLDRLDDRIREATGGDELDDPGGDTPGGDTGGEPGPPVDEPAAG